jgi:mitochondrial enoyl-[acyl-carrier protein] reductase / trans-2-enoyl-CoA reductase
MLRKVLTTPRLSLPLSQGRQWYHEASFATTGEPLDVLEYRAVADESNLLPPPQWASSVRIEMCDVPWNPADLNTVQGRYASPYQDVVPEREAVRMSRFFEGRTIAGSEGFFRVTHIHGAASPLNIGDLVTVGLPGLGTMRSSIWVPPTSLIPVTRHMELQTKIGPKAATLPQLGGTAIRMLRDFVHLHPGDTVIQNAGNSGVAFMVSQLAKQLLGVHVVSVMRRGTKNETEWQAVVDYLTETGRAAMVMAEEDIMDRDAFKEFQSNLRQISTSNKLPSLALNAVGGDSATILSRCLDHGGTMVTYGGMSTKPVTIGTAQFIFKDIRLLGYWHSRWMVQNDQNDKQAMLDELIDAVLDSGVECPSAKVFDLSKVHEAINFDANQSGIRRKIVFSCREQWK